MLSSYCENDVEAKQMKWMASNDSGSIWQHMVEGQGLGVGELLALFPSCCPTLSALVETLRPLPPRFYSIACSPFLHPTSVTVAFSIVRYSCGECNKKLCRDDPNVYLIQREGLCTSYMLRELSPWLCPDERVDAIPTRPTFFRIFVRQSTFRLPGSTQHPLIMIGLGTGVSPFIGFLEHRSYIDKKSDLLTAEREVCTGVWSGDFELQGLDLPVERSHLLPGQYQRRLAKGEMWLFYGCRNDDDFIFKVNDKLLSIIYVIFLNCRMRCTNMWMKVPYQCWKLPSHVYQQRKSTSLTSMITF